MIVVCSFPDIATGLAEGFLPFDLTDCLALDVVESLLRCELNRDSFGLGETLLALRRFSTAKPFERLASEFCMPQWSISFLCELGQT